MSNEDKLIKIPFSNNEESKPHMSSYEDDEGNYVLNIHKKKPSFKKSSHDENLAEKLPEYVLSSICQDLIGGIDDDKNSREVWAQIMDEGMEQLGYQNEERTWPFEGAAGTFSAALSKASITTSQTIIGELLPPGGPAKADLLGDPTEDQEERAEKMEGLFNIYTTRLDKSFYPEIKQAITWAINQGSNVVKCYIDPVTNMPIARSIRPDDFIVNTSATSLAAASRITQQLTMTAKEIKIRQEKGIYRDIPIHADSDMEMETSLLQERIEQIEGIQSVSYQYNKKFSLYECHADLELEKYEENEMGSEDIGVPKPYRITIDRKSRKILSIYRNWHEGDQTFKRIECFVPFNYLTGFGIYGLGLFHIASGSAIAATQIKRQLIDAGTLSNFPGGIRVKGMRFEDNNIRVGPTEYVEIDTGGLPIQQSIMPLPYKEPSSILKELKDDLEKDILELAGAANTQISEIQSNMPVGTILSIIESSQQIQTAIVQGMHRSMGEIFEILYRLFSEVFTEEGHAFHMSGKTHFIKRSDFKDDITIIPISDPNLSSFPKRAMTMEAIKGLCQEFPDYFNTYEMLKRYLKIIKVHNVDEILVDPNEQSPPPPMDPITENQNILTGKPVKAYIFQDQDAYIASKMPFMQDQSLDPAVLQAFKANIAERTAFKYQIMMQQMTGINLPEDPSQLKPEQQNKIAVAVAEASQQLMQQQQQAAPPTVEQIAMEEVKVKDKEADIHAQVEMAKLDVEKMKLDMEQQAHQQKMIMDQMKLELEQLKIEQEAKNKELQAQTEAFKAQLKYHSEEDKLKSQEDINNIPIS